MPTHSSTSCASACVRADVVQVVGDDQRQADLGRQAQQLLVEPALLGQAVVLELEEEAVLAEDVARTAPATLARRLPVVDLERPRDLAVEARRQADQALAVLGEVVAVDARLVVVAVEVRVGDEAAQVLVAGPVLGQQDQVVRLGVGLALLGRSSSARATYVSTPMIGLMPLVLRTPGRRRPRRRARRDR